MSNELLDINLYYLPCEEEKIGKKLKIFGKTFVENNKDKCKIIYKEKEYELEEYFNNIDDNYNYKDLLIIKLNGIKNITNISFMFHECKSLISIPDISEWNTSNVTNMNHMFWKCSSLISFPDIPKWNTSNVIFMDGMFQECI